MSGALIDRPRYLTEHLKELRTGFFRSLAALIVGTALAIWKSDWIFKALLFPFLSALAHYPAINSQVHTLQTLSPVEAFMINMKLAFAVGVVLASPFIFREIWIFASPALKQKERSAILMVFSFGLFFSWQD